MIKKGLIILHSLFIIFLLASCGGPAAPADTAANPPSMPSSSSRTAPPQKGESVAVIKTNHGTIKFKFLPDIAPETVKNFTELAKKGFYDGLTFHRVIPDFMIQGGDPTGDGTGGETYKGPGTMLKAEFSDKVSHIRGAVSMARKGNDVNSATSQFFIVQNPAGATFLDNQYTLFGQAFEGLDVVDAIAKTKRDQNDKPLVTVVMEKVTVEDF